MKLKYSFIAVLITASLLSCSNPNEKANQQKNDSIRIADSLAREKQRIIDSVDLVTREQQIIADSIQNQIAQ